jgi:hypothetical protein
VSAHPLTTFIYETFGRQFGTLILAGYGEEPDGRNKRLYLSKSDAGEETSWVIEMVARRPPCSDDPLVLAALLKLLLSRTRISDCLEFELIELLAELQWQDDLSTRQQAETAITSYVRLLYDKQVDARTGRCTSAIAGGGYYHLLTGYIRGTKSNASEALSRNVSSIYFDASFIKGLKQGRVYFAGIDFSSFNFQFMP